MLHYCQSCHWRWNKNFEELNRNNHCNCHNTHSCFKEHQTFSKNVYYRFSKPKVYYFCNQCKNTHGVKISRSDPIFLWCKYSIVDNNSTSWNVWSNKFCS